jgi:uncharacterized repeat protein (TIGR01451 family)
VIAVPSPFEVTNTSDSGPGSLRQAILNANTIEGTNLITFAIPGAGVHTISPLSPLPAITDAVHIDGKTQPGWNGPPLIELSGTGAGPTANGLVISGHSTTISALAINRFGTGGTITDPGGSGIVLQGSGSHRVQMNIIGADPTGTIARPNRGDGIVVDDSPSNLIGGTSPFGNLLSGNSRSGLRITGGEAIGTNVAGNSIGVTSAGDAALPNLDGITVLASAATIGGINGLDPNVISGNTASGITISGDNVVGTVVGRNMIGTDLAGAAALGNGTHGVLVTAGASSSSIGTLGSFGVTSNTIRFNTLAGVRIESGTGNVVQQSVISDNGGLGIDLGPEGVTLNDAGDVDAGANNLQNFPVVTAATTDGSRFTLSATLSGTPGNIYSFSFYLNPTCDASGHGEGATRLFSRADIVADANGVATFTANESFIIEAGQFVTAIATDYASNTSEFSACVPVAAVTGAADLSISIEDSPDPVVIGTPLTYHLTVANHGPDPAVNVVVSDVLPPNVAVVSAAATAGVCSATQTVRCLLGTIPSGTTASIDIVVLPFVPGTVENTASVTSAVTDPTAANNSATATTTTSNAPQNFAVTNTADSGAGSLRQAIVAVNANTNAGGFISFNIPGTGPFTIAPASPLPAIVETVYLDGTTQPGYSTLPVIEISGQNAGPETSGLVINGPTSLVRGLAINRFASSGVVVNATNVAIYGNLIGTNITGTAAAGNGTGLTLQGDGTLVGNLTAATANVISGNRGHGIRMVGSADSAVIAGNLIGTDVTGTVDVGNGQSGVFVSGEANFIGYPIVEGRNVISGNDQAGITLDQGASNTIAGNLIGTAADGTTALPNGVGIQVLAASSNTIGGVVPGYGNTIASNTGAGIVVSNSATNIAIHGNRIDRNGGLGIDLGDDGVTPNDSLDGDEGANNRTNFPVLAAAGGGIQGTLHSTPDSGFLVELFIVPACDASGHGEGATLVASAIQISTDGAGNATIPFTAAPAGAFVTATATDGSGNTSEFSACVRVPEALVLTAANSLPIGINRVVVHTVTLPQPAPAGGATVTVTSDNAAVAAVLTPATISIPAGTTTGTVEVRGVSAGGTTLRADGSGYVEGTLSVIVTPNLVSTPPALSIPFGQTGTLPVSIGPDPAPAGGLTLDVVSADSSTIEVVTPQITIAQGAFSANATVRGARVGNAVVTVSNPNYSPSSTSVTSSAALNILQATASFSNGLPPPTLTVRLESDGTPVAAQPALPVALTAANTACVSVPSSVTIPAGLVSTTFEPAYGGSAALPCTTTVTASANSLTSDVITVTVNPSPSINAPSPSTVAAGLMVVVSGSLSSSQHGGRVVTITSNDPSRVLVSPNGEIVGTASMTITVPNGNTTVSYYVHALEGVTGSTTVTLSATGFTGDTHQVTVAPAGVEIVNLNSAMTPFTPAATSYYAQVGLPCAGGATLCSVQNVRPGGPVFVVTLTNSDGRVARLRSDQPVATGQSVTKPIQPGVYYTQAAASGTSYGLAFEPIATGTTTVVVTGPAGVATMTSTGHRQVNVTTPAINMPSAGTVGAGLMFAANASLGASDHGGVVVTITSSDPTRFLVSPDTSTVGTASFTRTLTNGQTSVSYHVHGRENITGSSTITVSAPGFTSGTQTVTATVIGVEIVNLTAGTTTLSPPDTSWYVQIGLPCSGNASLCSVQNLRPGGPAFVVSLSLGATAAVARLRSDEPVAAGATVTKPIRPGLYYTEAVLTGSTYGLIFEPLTNGTAVVTVTGPAGVLTMTTSGQRQVNVTAPAINAPSNSTVGAGLMHGTSGSLGASQHGGVTVTIQSSDPARVLVSPDAATVGTTSFTRTLANGQTTVSYYVHGRESVSGTATVTISAPGFTSDSNTVTVVPIGVEIANLNSTTTNLSNNDTSWYVQVGLPCSGNASLCTVQNLRPGGPGVLVTIRNSNATVARLFSDEPVASGQSVTKPIQPGIYYTQAVAAGSTYGLIFEPLGNGSTTVSVTASGVLTMSATGNRTVTVNTPGISATAATTVGAGLQLAQSGALGAPQHGGVNVTITSSAPSVVRVAPDASTAGTTTISIPVANNSTGFSYVLQGVEGATGTAVVTMSAPGFTSATTTVTVETPAIEIQSLATSIGAGAADDTTWYVQIGIPNSGGTALQSIQNVRAGSPGVVITLTNSNAAAARLRSDEPAATGQTVSKPIKAGIYYTTALVTGTSYGLTFDPLAAGTTTVTATAPGVLQTTGAVRTVVVNP